MKRTISIPSDRHGMTPEICGSVSAKWLDELYRSRMPRFMMNGMMIYGHTSIVKEVHEGKVVYLHLLYYMGDVYLVDYGVGLNWKHRYKKWKKHRRKLRKALRVLTREV